MKIAFHDIYAHPLPEDHRFPMLKYELIPAQLLREGVITPEQLFTPQPATEAIDLDVLAPQHCFQTTRMYIRLACMGHTIILFIKKCLTGIFP